MTVRPVMTKLKGGGMKRDPLDKMEEKLDKLPDLDKALVEITLLRGIVDTVPIAIVGADESGHITFFNIGSQHLFGLTESEVIGHELKVLMPPRYWEAHENGLKRYVSTGESGMTGRRILGYGLHKSGAEFPVEIEMMAHLRDGRRFFTATIRPYGPPEVK